MPRLLLLHRLLFLLMLLLKKSKGRRGRRDIGVGADNGKRR
jgi:hypothetical protein